MKKRILITGGTGYIGSHTAVELIEAGYEIMIVDNLANSKIEVLAQIEAITGKKPVFGQLDICNFNEFDAFFAENQPIDAVIHFAAYKAVGESVENPLKYYHNNLQGLINLLRIMQKRAVPNLVFSSSCTVYGQPDELPVSENAPLVPANSPYGNTKQIAEDIIRDTVSASAVQAISLRYFNPIGAHKSALIGELPLGTPNNLVPFITQTAIGLRRELSVFGNDYNTPDGTAIRDYIHVVDLAKAHVVACKRILQKENQSGYEYFNLGTGKGSSVMEVIQSFERVSGQKLNYKVVARREGDIEQVWADTKLANQVLGWKTQKSLDEAMLSAWNWEKQCLKNQKQTT